MTRHSKQTQKGHKILPAPPKQNMTSTTNDNMSISFGLSLLTTIFLVKSTYGEELTPRCGDCWCIHDGISETCPTNTTGINDSFPATNEVYSTFQETNEVIKLLSPDGEECFPFANTLGFVEGFPESDRPQCHIPESTDETVCSYLYESGPVQSCNGRNYQIITYDSLEASNQAGANVVHKGACGVCSTAQDLWLRMSTMDTFESDTAVCAFLYLFNTDISTRFDSLVQCAKNSGFSDQCALLWAHVGAATALDCGSSCERDPVTGETILNGPPPSCTPDTCLSCADAWDENFPKMAGFTTFGAGFTERFARPCDVFYPVVHDPCVEATPPDPIPSPTLSPTAEYVGSTTPSGGNSNKIMNNKSMTVLVLSVLIPMFMMMMV